MTGSPLYRREVLAGRHNRWLGPLLLRQPVSHWVATWASLALVAGFVAFLYVGEYARKARVEGRLVPDVAGAAASHHPGLRAELAVPEGMLASIAVGDEVHLRYRAYPYQRYGQYPGRIVDLASTPMDTGAAPGAPTYAALVRLEDDRVRDDRGVEHVLRPGLGVEADVIVEKHRLYEWLFEPFLPSRTTREAPPHPSPSHGT